MTSPWCIDWARRRPAPRLRHFDNAAAGRQSLATLAATAAHARLEAEVGAYVAQEQVGDVLDGLRRDVGVLLGLPTDGVAFVESASAARAALLDAWPLPVGARIGVVPVEWGPNLEVFAARGMQLTDLPHEQGLLDVAGLARLLEHDPPHVVHLTQVTSHRGLVQPVAAALRVCRAAGVPLWVDAAQSIGHVDAALGADAVYATSRKWLTGPRGVGMLAVAAAHWPMLRVAASAMMPTVAGPVANLESHEAHVAGRVGLANAVREFLDAPDAVIARLAEVGRTTRAVLADLPGWTVVGAPSAATAGAIVALRPSAGQDVAATRRRLLDEHGILTTAGSRARAPRDEYGPLLRISPHVDAALHDLETLRSALILR